MFIFLGLGSYLGGVGIGVVYSDWFMCDEYMCYFWVMFEDESYFWLYIECVRLCLFLDVKSVVLDGRCVDWFVIYFLFIEVVKCIVYYKFRYIFILGILNYDMVFDVLDGFFEVNFDLMICCLELDL